MPESKIAFPKSYAELRRAVETALLEGQRSLERAKVRTYHETGRIISEHLFANEKRGEYGAGIVPRLAADLNLDRSVLQRCVQFYRAFPNCAAWHNLTWGHYRALIPVEDEKLRRSLAKDADRHGWTVADLESRTRAFTVREESISSSAAVATDAAPPKLLTPKRGTPGIYRVVARNDALAVDLGFKLYVHVERVDPNAFSSERVGVNALHPFSAGAFVRFDARGRVLPAEGVTKADLFTYAVTVRRVVDGDTLEIEVKLPRGYVHVMKLRLRGIDCPDGARQRGDGQPLRAWPEARQRAEGGCGWVPAHRANAATNGHRRRQSREALR